MDGAPACPFVAFGDDRDGRSTSPDHRHRCFAESPPAPRAVAHQEAYCLSSAFPVCPTFQDWARREAAHARGAGESEPRRRRRAVPAAETGRRPVRGRRAAAAAATRPIRPSGETRRGTGPRHRRGPRAPARCGRCAGAAGSAAGAGRRPRGAAGEPAGSGVPRRPIRRGPGPRRQRRGPTGRRAAARRPPGGPSAGDGRGRQRRRGRRPQAPPRPRRTTTWRVSPRAGRHRPRPRRGPAPSGLSASRRSTGKTASGLLDPTVRRRDPRPGLGGDAPLRGLPDDPFARRHAGPAPRRRAGRCARDRRARPVHAAGAARDRWRWRARMRSPSASRPVATRQRRDHAGARADARRSTSSRRSDTLSKVAKRFGITLEELLAANPDIKNPDKISIGQQIIIPIPVEDGAAPSASAAT